MRNVCVCVFDRVLLIVSNWSRKQVGAIAMTFNQMKNEIQQLIHDPFILVQPEQVAVMRFRMRALESTLNACCKAHT